MDAGRPGGGLPVEVERDSYGYTWLVSSHMSDEVEALVTDLHAVNSTLVDNGFGPQLLCTVVGFRDEAALRRFLDDPGAAALGKRFDDFIGPHAHRIFRQAPVYRADTLSAR